jgi:hypothetical protein
MELYPDNEGSKIYQNSGTCALKCMSSLASFLPASGVSDMCVPVYFPLRDCKCLNKSLIVSCFAIVLWQLVVMEGTKIWYFLRLNLVESGKYALWNWLQKFFLLNIKCSYIVSSLLCIYFLKSKLLKSDLALVPLSGSICHRLSMVFKI